MGFTLAFKERRVPVGNSSGGVNLDLVRRTGCQACPLNHAPGLIHPKMEPHGPRDAEVFFIGESPGQREDEQGRPFVGPAGQVLHFRVPKEWAGKMRMSNVINCHPPKNRDPATVEIEACRNRLVSDIERIQPRAVFGFGNVALHWVLEQTGIAKWRGRKIPVQIGKHACWFFPITHPSAILRTRKWEPRSRDDYGSDDELAFAHDLKRAFAAIPTLPEPVIHTRERAEEGVWWITGHGGTDDLAALSAFLKRAADADTCGIDFETSARRPYANDARILTAAISIQGETLAFALDHRQAGWRQLLPQVFSIFADFLRDARGVKAVHNLAFELEWIAVLLDQAIVRAGSWHDTMSQAFVLDDRIKMAKPDAISLEFLCLQYFGINVKALSSLNVENLDSEPLDEVLRYNGIDAKYHRLLYHAQTAALAAEGLTTVYEDHLRRIATMVLTQVQGLPIDWEVVHHLDETYRQKLDEYSAVLEIEPLAVKFKSRFGHTFRPTSNDDIRKLLALGGVHAETADESQVSKLNDTIREPLQAWRKLAKAHSTYIKPQLIKRHDDGMLHPMLSTCATRTSRTSSEEPNSQNYPKRSEEHRSVRGQIKPGPGLKVVSFDYASIQARNIAMESRDETLVQAFWDDYDIHMDWMERIARLHPKWVTEGVKALVHDKALRKIYRNRAKNELVFPHFFGAEGKTVANYLGIPENVGMKLSDDFNATFPGVHTWQEGLRKSVKRLGYVTGLSGYRRRIPISKNELINSPIQADEAAIVCDAMTRLSEQGLQASLEIHDDLTFIWETEKVDEYAQIALSVMLFPTYEWAKIVPIGVEMSVGDSWADLVETGKFSSATWR